MNVQRAQALGVIADECTVEAHSRKYGGAWLVLWNGSEVRLTADMYDAVQFVAALRRANKRSAHND